MNVTGKDIKLLVGVCIAILILSLNTVGNKISPKETKSNNTITMIGK
jgi:hypothetical protein